MINENIIAARKNAASRLSEIITQAEQGIHFLNALETASAAVEGPKQPLLDAIKKNRHDLQTLIGRAKLREQRFQSGLVTVAVGGIEKSGKTTMLKALTGIQELPTAMARCTAVCCEIIYSETRNDFDLEFHAEHEFCQQILHPIIDRFNGSQSEEKIGIMPASLEEFRRIVLPPKNAFVTGTDPEIQLSYIRHLHTYIEEVRSHVGRAPQRALPMDSLSRWTANSDDPATMARISTVARCIIHTKFNGGSPNLRWIDTPGVDDPSPLARNRTLQTISRETDLLVVATMPGDKPSPTKSFSDFWTSINQITDEVRLLDRLLILLNWNKTSDPTGQGIQEHHRILREGKSDIFCGPLQANISEELAGFVGRVNQHLATNLPLQDAKVINHLYNNLRSVQAAIRRDVFDKAHQLSVGDPSNFSAEQRLFDEWFEKARPNGQIDGFWPRLCLNFNNTADSLPESDEIKRAAEQIKALFETEADKIWKSCPQEDVIEDRMKQKAGQEPIGHFMNHFASGEFSNLANALSDQVEGFSPIIQNAVMGLLHNAGLGPLLSLPEVANDPEKLYRKLREHDTQDNPVLNALEQLAKLKSSMQYVYRWEMRPAINFLSPWFWEKKSAIPQLHELLKRSGLSNSAEELNREFPDGSYFSAPSKRSERFSAICKFALRGIEAVLKSDRCNFAKIADDLIRETQMRLAISEPSRQAWRDLLRNYAAVLVGDKITQLRANSERLQAFREAREALGKYLP
jgi:hypothetical protein